MKEFKIVVLGNGGVGKSALTLQYVQGIFVHNYDATIEDSYRKLSKVDAENARLEILDTAGTEQFTGMRETYYRTAQGFVLVFSLAETSTFENLKQTILEIMAIRGEEVPMVLVGNKSDLAETRQVEESDAQNFARKLRIPYIETSARLNQNVSEVFEECAVLIQKSAKNHVERRRWSSESEIRDKKCKNWFKSCCCCLIPCCPTD
ncbi:hypothetical protein GCK72_014071 [Caenorhabditis remanei]|uniref:Uncharacterized protein n=1 Tax=Caenorhabditis remanei TaxID=31234 RepID=A0A6A5GSZ5_CAERE|nr:hypothetical protein GCK72_014071 [Caenorhabditis remanei]KAF1757615.1 hypothetical protein GCK72_014071 [Caenorhabditis remanei]